MKEKILPVVEVEKKSCKGRNERLVKIFDGISAIKDKSGKDGK